MADLQTQGNVEEMTGQKKNWADIAIIVFALLLVGVLATAAYLTALANDKVNQLNTGIVEVTLMENGSAVTGSNIVSFGEEDKQVSVKNTGTATQFVRVQIGTPMENATLTNGGSAYLPADASNLDSYGFADPGSDNTVTIGTYVYHFASNWSDNWFYYHGSFYCKTPIAEGETTPVLLMGITDTSTDSETMVASVTVDGIQSSPSSYVEDAWGVNASDDGLAKP